MKGDNLMPIDADPLRDRLAEQYGDLTARADELEAALARVPEFLDEKSIDRATGYVKQLRAASNEAEDKRKAEKRDFLEAGRKVDSFFKAITARMEIAAAALEVRVRTYLETTGAPRIRGALGGTATLATTVDFDVLDRLAAVRSLADFFDDEAVAKAARAYLRANKDNVVRHIKAKSQPIAGIRFFEAHKARVS